MDWICGETVSWLFFFVNFSHTYFQIIFTGYKDMIYLQEFKNTGTIFQGLLSGENHLLDVIILTHNVCLYWLLLRLSLQLCFSSVDNGASSPQLPLNFSSLGSVGFSHLYMCIFHHIWECFGNNFLKCVFCCIFALLFSPLSLLTPITSICTNHYFSYWFLKFSSPLFFKIFPTRCSRPSICNNLH